MKKIALFLSTVLLVGLFAGCSMEASGTSAPEPADTGAATSASSATSAEKGTGTDGDEITVGLSVITLENMFFVNMVDGFVENCEKRGWKYTYSDGGQDAAKQVSDIEDAQPGC